MAGPVTLHVALTIGRAPGLADVQRRPAVAPTRCNVGLVRGVSFVVVHSWAVDCAVLRAGGQSSFWTAPVLRVLLAARGGHHAVVGRRMSRKDAVTAVGAVGTAAAVIGTAAIVRHAKRKNKA